MLQGSTLDVLEGHQMASTVKSKIIARRNEDNEFDKVYGNMLGMAERAGMDALDEPRICGRQTQWNNVQLDHQKNIFNWLFLFHIWTVSVSKQGLRALSLIPSHLFKDDEEAIVANDLYKFNSNDLPFPQAFHQEIALWKTMWNNSPIKPNSLVTTIADRNAFPTMFPTIIELLSTIDLCNIKWSGKS